MKVKSGLKVYRGNLIYLFMFTDAQWYIGVLKVVYLKDFEGKN